MAHVFAAIDGGPRTDTRLTAEQRGAYENLILLCSSCHTLVDKAPDDFTAEDMVRWREEHARKLATLFGAAEFNSRADVRQALDAPLDENRHIFESYGPDNDYRMDPESEMADAWQRKVVALVIPNNQKALAILDANRRHLTPPEVSTLEEFRQHVDDMAARHLQIGNRAGGKRFPSAMNTILRE